MSLQNYDRSAPAPKSHIPSLDGLRAVSFVLVFLGHNGLNDYVPAAFGVTVFFFISGYLITTLLRLERERSGTNSLKNFYLRRALRILPPFYIVMVLALLCWAVGLLAPPDEPASITAVLLHYANYYIVKNGDTGFLTGTGVYWSLAVEEHFYLLFPALYLGLQRLGASRRQQLFTLVGLCGLILCWRLYLHFVAHADHHRTAVASDTRFDSILFGCALALYGNPWLDETRFSEKVWKLLFFPVGALVIAGTFLVRSDAFRETVRYTVQGIALVPVLVCAIRYPTWAPVRVLNSRPFVFIGVLSYSLYLTHLIILGALGFRLGNVVAPWALAGLGFALTVAFGWLMSKVVEEPFARLRAKLHASPLDGDGDVSDPGVTPEGRAVPVAR